MKMQMECPLVIALMLLGGVATAQQTDSASVDATSPSGAKKRIVICLDGTSNNAYKEKERYSAKEGDDSKVLKPSNVLKTCRAVLPEADGVTQITYYDIGVGALSKHPGAYNRLLRTADSVLGGAWGAGFESRVEDAYRFLSHNYVPGDDVFVFGFSRGAAAARALGRFIDWMGGVPSKRDVYWIPIFFRSYETSAGRAEGAEVLRTEHEVDIRPVEINFLGVWDTVLALGSRLKTRTKAKAFHIGETPPRSVRVARQALAIAQIFLPSQGSGNLPCR